MKNPLTSTIILPCAIASPQPLNDSGGMGYGFKYNPNYSRVYLSFLYIHLISMTFSPAPNRLAF